MQIMAAPWVASPLGQGERIKVRGSTRGYRMALAVF